MSRVRDAREPAPKPRHKVPSSRGRQRPIRSTLTILLVIPLVSLIALWAYAASSTVGGAIGKRNSDTANKVIGAPTQALLQELVLERSDTFIWQSAHGLQPRTGLDAQRKQTDAAVAGFRHAGRPQHGRPALRAGRGGGRRRGGGGVHRPGGGPGGRRARLGRPDVGGR